MRFIQTYDGFLNESAFINESAFRFLGEAKEMEVLVDLEEVGKNPSDFFGAFDGIYVINLKQRDDRLKSFKDQMKAAGVNAGDIKRVEGYNGKEMADKVFKDPMYLLDKYSDLVDVKKLTEGNLDRVKQEPGCYACSESHRLAVMQAQKDGCKRPLIFEDDAVLTKALFTQGSKMRERIDSLKYDFLNMGLGETKFNGRNFNGRGLVQKLVKGSPTKFHAYSVEEKSMDDFIKASLKNWTYHVDIVVTNEFRDGGKKFYAMNPRPFTQLGDHSDIQGKEIGKGGKGEMAFKFEG